MNAVESSYTETVFGQVRELWCGGCGYGVVVRREPPECPMCRESSWRERPTPARYN